MIRTVAIILALSTSFVALSAMEASAQVTEQTDKSEEDWRKSQKKRDSSDIFEDILNRRSTGQGNGTYPQNPIDSLPEDSRRHLMKERAKVIAESDPGTTPDAPYTPSDAAKTDPELAEQEKEAWTVIMTDMKGGSSSGQGQAGIGPNKVAIAGQGGGQGGDQGDSQMRNSSVMRGGSSQSVADILAQIKGIKSAGGGQGRSGGSGGSSSQGPLGTGSNQQQGSQGKAGQGQAGAGSQAAQQAQAQAEAQAQAQAQADAATASEAAAQAQVQADSAAEAARQAQAEADAQGDSTSKMKAEIANDIAQMAQAKADAAAQDAAKAQAQSAAQAQENAQASAQAEALEKAKQAPESIGPLDRIKREREDRPSGTQTSASDYLKTSK